MKSFVMIAVFSFLVLLCGCATPPVEKPPEPEKTCVPRVVILKGVNFDHDKASLKPESYPVLDSNIEILKTNPKITIIIVGHTDGDGSAAYNQRLSLARAKTVMKYFNERGISADRMTAVGKGAAIPIASNVSEAGRAQNRRIEIEFTDPDQGTVICQ